MKFRAVSLLLALAVAVAVSAAPAAADTGATSVDLGAVLTPEQTGAADPAQ